MDYNGTWRGTDKHRHCVQIDEFSVRRVECALVLVCGGIHGGTFHRRFVSVETADNVYSETGQAYQLRHFSLWTDTLFTVAVLFRVRAYFGFVHGGGRGTIRFELQITIMLGARVFRIFG